MVRVTCRDMVTVPQRVRLAQLPTPLERLDRLSEAWAGPTIWCKRDDLTGFELSGNKVRKLEYHLAAAQEADADTIITCGAAQSNHCRATAFAAARLGIACILMIRTPDGGPVAPVGNHLLHHLAGAEVRYVDVVGYDDRDAVMSGIADEVTAGGGRPWVIPEGASDVLGMFGFVSAMRELAEQLATWPTTRPPTVWHAASSGGTTAGLGWAADRLALSVPLVAVSVGDPAVALRAQVERIWSDAIDRYGGRVPSPDLDITDAFLDGGYGVWSDRALSIQAEATALTGLIFDPTYTGKAIVALRMVIEEGRFSRDDHVVYWHTGGGFAVFGVDPDRLVPGVPNHPNNDP